MKPTSGKASHHGVGRRVRNSVHNIASKLRGKHDPNNSAEEERNSSAGAFNAATRQYDPNLYAEVRDAWVRRHMQVRESEFTLREPLSVTICTWNVAAKKPPLGSELRGWLQVVDLPEVYVVGLQEVVDLSAPQNLNAGSGGQLSSNAQAWENVVSGEVNSIEKSDGYVQLVCRQLMGMLLLVYVRKDLMPCCSMARTISLGTGLLGVMGNKGAVACSLRIHSSTLCFICAHLASGASATEARNAEVAHLLQKISFTPGGSEEGTPEAVLDHEFVFFFGDLNYRLELDGDVVRQAVVDGDLKMLRKHDQLLESQAAGLCFANFEEPELSFDPTYKYDVGTHTYDTSEKRRVPAWCDRVLWRGAKAHVECRSYGRSELTTSDHRPVAASLVVRAAVHNAAMRLQIESEILRSLDAWENSCVPTATLDSSDIDLGHVRFDELHQRSLLFTNTGQTPLQFSFQPLPDGNASGGFQEMPPWLYVSPWSGLLVPGEACTIRVRARVYGAAAAELNGVARWKKEAVKLEAILLLRLLHGRDYYVTVRGEWMPSCLGVRLTNSPRAATNSAADSALHVSEIAPELHALLGSLEPHVEAAEETARSALRTIESAEAKQAGASNLLSNTSPAPSEGRGDYAEEGSEDGGGSSTGEQRAAAPRDSAMLGDASRRSQLAAAMLHERFLFVRVAADCEAAVRTLEDLFVQSGDADECTAVIGALDRGEPLPHVAPVSLASALLRWLHCLSEAVVYDRHYYAAEACRDEAEAAAVVLNLPHEHHLVFEQLILFVRRLLHAHAAVHLASCIIETASSVDEDDILDSHMLARRDELENALRGIAERCEPHNDLRAVASHKDDAAPSLNLASKLAMVFGDAIVRLAGNSSSAPAIRFSSQLPAQPLAAWSSSRNPSISHMSVHSEGSSPEVRLWKMAWMLLFLPQPAGDLASLVRAINELPQTESTLPWRFRYRTPGGAVETVRL
ncbi:hypothetical protein AB1Y20_001217 [Prymnesium parvum]|uniref:Phosphoinositide 5-phosphatase n=1 Tax=Prymnesium parvum TaxID=97485 RepID=A0AB34KAF8_PRYPA